MTEAEPQDPPAAKKPRRFNSLILFAVLLIALYVINYRPDIATIACTDDIIATEPDVIMLGTWWCPYCADARRYFHDNEIHYCEYDIERTAKGKQMYDELGGNGIPVLIIGDKYRLEGYDERMIEKALALTKE
jgi:glutaredoxin